MVLDDRAVYELEISKYPRNRLEQFWGHDFNGSGQIRVRRPHRGRAAVGDRDAQGNDKYHFTYVGTKKEKYYYTGEENYRPIIYLLSTPDSSSFDNPQMTDSELPTVTPKQKYHNQHTSKELMVKNGAPSNSVAVQKRRDKEREQLSADLTRLSKSSPHSHKARLFGQELKLGPTKEMCVESPNGQEIVDGGNEIVHGIGSSIQSTQQGPIQVPTKRQRDEAFEPTEIPITTNYVSTSGMNTVSWTNTAGTAAMTKPAEQPAQKHPTQILGFFHEEQGAIEQVPAPFEHEQMDTATESSTYVSRLEREVVKMRSKLAQKDSELREKDSEIARLRLETQ